MFPRNDLALHRDATHRYLPWILGFMTFLALLAGFTGIYLKDLSFRWHHLLGVHLTIEIPVEDVESKEDPSVKTTLIIQNLKGIAGIQDIEAITQEEITNLLRPWLGSGFEAIDLPFPILLRIIPEANQSIDLDELKQKLAKLVPDAQIDDKAEWLGNAVIILDRLELFSWLVMALSLLIATVSVVMISKMALAVHRRTIEIVHLIGAQDNYIARQFALHAFKMAFKGAIIGAFLASLSLFAIAYGFSGLSESSWATSLRIIAGWPLLDWLFLALLPLGTIILSGLAARFTVARELKANP